MEFFNNINEILDFAINAEQEAVDFYSALATGARNQDIAATFEEFAREEMKHKANLIRIKEQGLFLHRREDVPDLKIADYLVDVKPSPDLTYGDALLLAMQKEKAAFRLYSDLAGQAPDDMLKQIFLSLAQEESKHKLRFELEYDEYVLREN